MVLCAGEQVDAIAQESQNASHFKPQNFENLICFLKNYNFKTIENSIIILQYKK